MSLKSVGFAVMLAAFSPALAADIKLGENNWKWGAFLTDDGGTYITYFLTDETKGDFAIGFTTPKSIPINGKTAPSVALVNCMAGRVSGYMNLPNMDRAQLQTEMGSIGGLFCNLYQEILPDSPLLKNLK